MIYICYGVTKTASTYLYQLTEEVFRVARGKPARIGPPLLPTFAVNNYFDVIDPPLIEHLGRLVGDQDLVLKTHGFLHPEIAERIAEGNIMASASIRDPREIALSMLDHGRRQRKAGAIAFTELVTLEQAMLALDGQVAGFRQWAGTEGVRTFTYNQICFQTEAVVGRIADQIGVSLSPKDALRPFLNRMAIGELNVAEPLRYKEMPEAAQAVFLNRYAELYLDFDLHEGAAHAPPGQLRPRGPILERVSVMIRFIRRWSP